MNTSQIDIKEKAIKALDPKILALLLKDKSREFYSRKRQSWAS